MPERKLIILTCDHCGKEHRFEPSKFGPRQDGAWITITRNGYYGTPPSEHLVCSWQCAAHLAEEEAADAQHLA